MLRPAAHQRSGLQHTGETIASFLLHFQVRSVPVRKDDEVSVVRGTYKVSSMAAFKVIMQLALHAAELSAHCILGQALRALVLLCQSLVRHGFS